MSNSRVQSPRRISTGLTGLDEVLCGGLPAGRTYLVWGPSGSGKTTLALQYALEGARRGERVLFVMLTETREEIMEVIDSHGWSLGGLHLHEVIERPETLMREAESTLFTSADLELGATVKEIIDLTHGLRPTRVVLDPLSELRAIAVDSLRFRRQFLALKQVFADVGATGLLVEEMEPGHKAGDQLENIAHGVLLLEQQTPTYGPERRRLRVVKVRGISYLGGHHDLDIRTGGIEVYPRPIDVAPPVPAPPRLVSTRSRTLDDLLGGGLETGATTIVMGEPGTGKSSVISHCVSALASQDFTCLMYLFEERAHLFLQRASSLGLPIKEQIEAGSISLHQVDPEQMSPGRLIQHIRDFVGAVHRGVVVLDSLGGLSRSLYEEPFLPFRLRELLSWLSRRGVVTFASLQTPSSPERGDISYLADTVILLRHLEREMKIEKSISVLKRRGGAHDSSVRRLLLTPAGLEIGQPISSAQPGEPPRGQPVKEHGEASGKQEQTGSVTNEESPEKSNGQPA